jgi:N-acetylneuraminate synthase
MSTQIQAEFRIGDRSIGPGNPVYVVAEISANHHQDFQQAVRLVHAAKDAGADAIKLQTYTADTLTIACDRDCFRVAGGTLWDGRSLHDLYREAYTPWEWQPKLKHVAEDAGLALFSSPFDSSAVDFLERMDVPAYKLASFEIVDIPLIRIVARTGKPLIISTGMATLAEIEEAVQAALLGGASHIALLKCTSSYPASPDSMNLRTIPEMSRRFDLPVGLSDHTVGIAVPVAAVSLGACIVEKHLTLSRSVEGPDSAFSLEPQEFREMVDAVRIAERALGNASFGCTGAESASLAFRRSLFVVQGMRKGDFFTDQNVRSIRPGHGMHTRYLPDVLGLRAAADIGRGTPLRWELVEKE